MYPLRKMGHSNVPQLYQYHISSDDFPPLTFNAELYGFILALLYMSILIGGWNFHFPTNTEKVLWRIASMLILVGFTPACVASVLFDYMFFGRSKYSRRNPGATDLILDYIWKTLKLKPLIPISYTADLEKTLIEKPWLVYLPGLALKVMMVYSAAYSVIRAYILVEDFIGLRELPESAFETVVWTEYLPKI